MATLQEDPSSEKIFGAGRTPTCRNFGQNDFQKFRFFGLKSAIFGSDKPVEPKNELGTTKKFSDTFGTPLVRAEKISTTPPHKGRFWGCRNFCKIAFLGLISAFFDSGRPTESQDRLGDIKIFLRELWKPFGIGQKNFDHPAPKRSILGVQKFLPNRF